MDATAMCVRWLRRCSSLFSRYSFFPTEYMTRGIRYARRTLNSKFILQEVNRLGRGTTVMQQTRFV